MWIFVVKCLQFIHAEFQSGESEVIESLFLQLLLTFNYELAI